MATTMQRLQRGSSGAAVAEVQQRLNEQGADPQLDVDGEFGPLTEAAVKAFQSSHGLESDGIVGPLTAAALGIEAPTEPTEPAGNLTDFVLIPDGINWASPSADSRRCWTSWACGCAQRELLGRDQPAHPRVDRL